jgi:TM2 domain-containing membrane protein YozV
VASSEVSQKKMVAGILGILLGGLGAHRFYLGDTTGGIIRLVISVVTCGAGGIIGLIEGIMYLIKPDDEFEKTYLIEKKAWF